MTKLTKELLEWDKSGPLGEKDKDLSIRKKMILSLLSSKASKNFPLLILSYLERTMTNLRKYLTALFKWLVASTIDNVAAKKKEVKISTDEMRLPEFNQLKQLTLFHHQKQHHKDKPNLPQPNRIFRDNLQ